MDRKKFLISTGTAAAASLIINPLLGIINMDNNKLIEDSLYNTEMSRINRKYKEEKVPLIAVKGTAYECGLQLGEIWRDIIRIRVTISSKTEKGRPWWAKRNGIVTKLLNKYAPHLPDIMRGMQEGAGLGNEPPLIWDWPSGAGNFMFKDECTSFAVKSAATFDGVPLAGQTKDTEEDRLDKYQILKLEPTGAPSFLTLTYPGELFGHGFATTGVSLFRNALYFSDNKTGIPFNVWGLIALCSSIDTALECALEYGIKTSGNALISDGENRSVSVECIPEGIGIIESDKTIHVHTNHLLSPELQYLENKKDIRIKGSEMRYNRLRELLNKEIDNAGKISPARSLQLLGDHENYPFSICRHNDGDIKTTAAVVVEPTKRTLHVVRGNPCMNWPVSYTI